VSGGAGGGGGGVRIGGGKAQASSPSSVRGSTNGLDNIEPEGPDYVVSPNGTAFPVPKGAAGPSPVLNQAGKLTGSAFKGGRGGTNGQVNSMRLMNPTTPRGSSPGYPNGYIKYENRDRQGVDPYTGQTIPNSISHFPIE